eukprot:PhF_6_TR6063/c0_g1_i2/m.8791/K03977/engA, der; GTPase
MRRLRSTFIAVSAHQRHMSQQLRQSPPPTTANVNSQSLYSSSWQKLMERSFGRPAERAPPLGNESTPKEHTSIPIQPLVLPILDNRLRVAVVGAMNVGKSTLFNMLVYERIPSYHFVANAEGITRDAVEAHAKLGDIEFTAIDTPGLVDGSMIHEAHSLLQSSDVAIIVMSAEFGIRDEERKIAEIITKYKLPAILVVNKMDMVNYSDQTPESEYDDLMLGEPIRMSLKTKQGTDELYQAIKPHFEIGIIRRTQEDWALEDAAMSGDEESLAQVQQRNSLDKYIRIAMIGRPNSGKSSLFNRITGMDRSREAPFSGTTRDAVEVKCVYKGHKFKFVDTPGFLRIRSFRGQPFNEQLWKRTRSIIRFSHVCVIVIDSTEGCPAKGDLIMGYRCIDEGKAMTFAANKWDLVGDSMSTAEAIDYKLKKQLHEVKYCSAVAVSAHTGQNLELLLDHVITLFETWNKRISTSRLTSFWRRLEKTVTIPHHVSRVRKLEQINVRPPTFMLHLQTRDDRKKLSPAYENMVRNAIVEEFGFQGVPIRIFQSVKDAHRDMDW